MIFHQSCLDWLEMNFNQENLHAKFQAKMGLGHSLKILSSFQAKSQTILGAKIFLFKMNFDAFEATFKIFLTLHSVKCVK